MISDEEVADLIKNKGVWEYTVIYNIDIESPVTSIPPVEGSGVGFWNFFGI